MLPGCRPTLRLNLASFVTTWMEPECDELVQEARAVNFIDYEQYPSSQEMHHRWGSNHGGRQLDSCSCQH
jgi:glutamate/tyrosine decarboxylase-like PLP-dependent enzyme